MKREYFSIALSPNTDLAIPLENMGAVIQIETTNICTVPGVANFWYGVINYKGSLLWVLDSDSYFFGSDSQRDFQLKKFTAVILKPNQQDNNHKIALTTPKLEGIIALDSAEARTSNNTNWETLNACSFGAIERETRHIFILNNLNLLQQLNQKSSLVSA